MQQVFLCPTCGAQNIVGQEFCQSCGQRFRYDCPYCGATVDSTLINCPRCRQTLYWPTPQKVKPFPKQKIVQQHRVEVGGEEREKPEKKKSDLWLIGCLGAVIVAILVLGAYFIYDNFIRKVAPPVSENETGFMHIQTDEGESFKAIAIALMPGIEADRDV